jgi:opacity protein-like surface antigen
MQRFSIRYRIAPSLVLSLSLLTIHAGKLHSQASPTASKGSTLSVFGAYSRISTDREASSISGITFGTDLSIYAPGGFVASLETRFQIAPGSLAYDGQDTYGGGIRMDRPIKRFVPYIDFLVSSGHLSFTNPTTTYKRDNSVVYSGGGGLEYNLSTRWAARADYLFEHWDIGTTSNLQNGIFSPQIITFGIAYRIPFRPYNPH